MTDVALLNELEPAAASLVERHLATAKEWFPHELVPWSMGRDFEKGEPVAEEGELSPGVRSALFVNVLTEDNLPYYFEEIKHMFGADGAWGEWSRRWTAEEGRHSIVIRDYLTVTRQVDPVNLERARMAQVSGGISPHPGNAMDGFAYLALQELATRIAHHNTGKALPDPAGYEIMKRVAADENLHFLFYRDLVGAAMEADPSTTVEAIERQVTKFQMPGTGIPGFAGHARAIANEGIYSLAIHHERILDPVVRKQWGIEALGRLSASAEAARERLLHFLDRMAKVAARMRDRAAEGADKAMRRTG
ncbi:MAG TPA: acyl-ACP desaturase [Acidimicrobiales bacterium]|nr:acyl-ACP desaturase [Acidimicrobiales bacterium]